MCKALVTSTTAVLSLFACDMRFPTGDFIANEFESELRQQLAKIMTSRKLGKTNAAFLQREALPKQVRLAMFVAQHAWHGLCGLSK